MDSFISLVVVVARDCTFDVGQEIVERHSACRRIYNHRRGEIVEQTARPISYNFYMADQRYLSNQKAVMTNGISASVDC